MTTTAIGNDFDDTIRQAREWLGEVGYFDMMDRIKTREQRVGQAFVNALSPKDNIAISGTDADPFHQDNWDAVQKALDFLLENA